MFQHFLYLLEPLRLSLDHQDLTANGKTMHYYNFKREKLRVTTLKILYPITEKTKKKVDALKNEIAKRKAIPLKIKRPTFTTE